jgi:hypothetical protein
MTTMRIFKFIAILAITFSAIGNAAIGQTNPAAQSLPYSQNFSGFTGTVTASNGINIPNGNSITLLTQPSNTGNPANAYPTNFIIGNGINGSLWSNYFGIQQYSSSFSAPPARSSIPFVIDYNGRVGINAANNINNSSAPTYTAALTVDGSTNYSGLTQNPMPSGLTIGTTTGTQQLLFGSYYTSDVGQASAIQSVDYYSGLDHTKSLLLNPQGGNIGIGTTSPSTALQVNGTVTATSFNSLSDYRIKEQVVQLDNTFSIDSLKPITYYNKDLKKKDIGLIAHELQEVYPELVTGEKDGKDMQTVNYAGLIPILIKEIQDLKARVSELEQKNNNKI